MNLLRFSIILLLVIGLVPLASADIVHTHALSGTYDEINTSDFAPGYGVTDVVTSNSTNGVGMWFLWYRNGVGERITYTADYVDVLPALKTESGSWVIRVDEVNSETYTDNPNWINLRTGLIQSSEEIFTVSAAPEFSFGSLIAMLFAGMIYLIIRRNLNGSCQCQQIN